MPRRMIRALATVTAALTLAAGLGPVQPAAAETLGGDGRPITNSQGKRFGITAHRGGALERPENSLEAFRYSVDQRFDAIETDLLFTKDGHGVMAHYDTIPSRCSHAGKKLHQMTLTQVREVRCADLAGLRTVPIPTFDELAEVVRPSGILLTLDLKTYSGQSASGKRSYARRAIELLRKHALLERTMILAYQWEAMLPTIRKLAPRIRVIGLDNRPMSHARVNLAAKLGANGYGVKVANTPVNLMRYIQSKKMDPVPWDVRGPERLAYSIHFGPKVQNFLTDTPAASRTLLVNGTIGIDVQPTSVRTTLSRPVQIARKAGYKANKRRYPKVVGVAVPADQVAMLETVTLAVKVTKGPGKGYLYAGAAGSPLKSNVRVKLPKGTRTVKLKVPVGDAGKVRLYTSRKATLTVAVVEYSRLRFG